MLRYDSGESTRVLGRAYGVDPSTITRHLVAAGVKMRTYAQAAVGNKSKLGHYKRGGPLSTMRGYLSTRDREGNKYLIHRACWEAYFGPIPDGHVVHHCDEDRRHNDIGNLSCITHGEHSRLHNLLR